MYFSSAVCLDTVGVDALPSHRAISCGTPLCVGVLRPPILVVVFFFFKITIVLLFHLLKNQQASGAVGRCWNSPLWDSEISSTAHEMECCCSTLFLSQRSEMQSASKSELL